MCPRNEVPSSVTTTAPVASEMTVPLVYREAPYSSVRIAGQAGSWPQRVNSGDIALGEIEVILLHVSATSLQRVSGDRVTRALCPAVCLEEACDCAREGASGAAVEPAAGGLPESNFGLQIEEATTTLADVVVFGPDRRPRRS